MKKLFIALCLFAISSITTISGATLTVHVGTPGTIHLSHNLTYEEMRTVTKLIVTGKINAVDFHMLQNPDIFMYQELDLSGAVIYEYTGNTGTHSPSDGSIITYPANTIPEYAFKNLMLTSIVLPTTLTAIDKFAFYNCAQLHSITFPNTLVSIGASAFLNCISLITVSLPENVTLVDQSAFAGCWELATVNSLGSITAIPNSMFNSCTKLTTVKIPSKVTSIGEAAFTACSSLTNIDIPASVTSFGAYAFSNCSSLSSISFPENTTSIGVGAFDYCMGLTSVYCYRSLPPVLDWRLKYFDYVDFTKCTLHVPQGSRSAYLSANVWELFYRHIVEFIPSATNLPNTNNVSLHFNSATDNLTINGVEGNASLSVHDINGRFMSSKEFTGNETISLCALAKGIYVVCITSKNGKAEKKLIKD